MPELPEVETMRRGILPVVGATITGVYRTACRRKPIAVTPALPSFRRRAVGARIRSVDRLGKRLLVWLDSDHAVVLEPRMTGLILLQDPPTQEHLRLRLDLGGTELDHLWYWDRRGLGSVRLLSRQQVAEQLGSPQLGPDALTVDAELLRARLGKSRRAVKVALLDQKALAGIGNLYASEILHVAQVDPRAHCHRLTRVQWRRIAESMRDVLHEAIRYEGSTLADGTYRTVLNDPGNYQNHHRVYGREGAPCPQCQRSPVRRIVQAQRSTFFCPACQTRRPRTPRGGASKV